MRYAKFRGKLGSKINGILLLFFVVALLIILMTLHVGRQLEGGAAAINEAGAERMRTYRIAYLIEKSVNASEQQKAVLEEAREEVRSLEAALDLLEHGDPDRPLFLPRDAHIRETMQALRQQWEGKLRPLMMDALEATERGERLQRLKLMDAAVRDFVPRINTLVLLVEGRNSRNTDLMWLFQNALVGFALMGTLFLVYLFNNLVIRPVETLKGGMDSMAAADFGVRLPVESNDEFGELAQGFNRMADRLRDLYDTLEQRVAAKTSDLEERNRELGMLYEIAAYLGEPAQFETLAGGVLNKLRSLLGAEAGAVRLIDAKTQEMEIIASINLSERFLEAEARMPLGVCLCGRAAICGESIAEQPSDKSGMLSNCQHEGLQGMVAIPIKSQNQVFGIFNLFFYSMRKLALHEVQLLEAVGQHLAVALENQRLAVREKEMAVSEERNLLAQELHDSIAQSLAFLNIQAQMLEGSLRDGHPEIARQELSRIREGIQESYDTVRELLVHFRIKVEHADLDEAIGSALEKFEGQTGIRTEFEKSGEFVAPPATSAIQILHIVQEVLSNVRKHSGASRVQVRMQGGDAFSIVIRDDGRGFVLSAVAEDNGAHVGIDIMRERAHRIGAHFNVDSTPGRGTTVTLHLPRSAR